MRISASITGMTDFERRAKTLMTRSTYEKPLNELVSEIATLAKTYAPRKTGDLEESIKPFKTGFGKFKIVVGVPYAEYMEFGTRFFPVGTADAPLARTSTSGKACFHPFLRTATWEKMNSFPDIIKKVLFSTF